jgi:hypothetical protein
MFYCLIDSVHQICRHCLAESLKRLLGADLVPSSCLWLLAGFDSLWSVELRISFPQWRLISCLTWWFLLTSTQNMTICFSLIKWRKKRQVAYKSILLVVLTEVKMHEKGILFTITIGRKISYWRLLKNLAFWRDSKMVARGRKQKATLL